MRRVSPGLRHLCTCKVMKRGDLRRPASKKTFLSCHVPFDCRGLGLLDRGETLGQAATRAQVALSACFDVRRCLSHPLAYSGARARGRELARAGLKAGRGCDREERRALMSCATCATCAGCLPFPCAPLAARRPGRAAPGVGLTNQTEGCKVGIC